MSINIENSMKKISNYCLKYGFHLICLIGFLYQTSLLMTDYLSGTTVVSIKLGRLQIDSLPAITICFNHFYSSDKVFKNRAELNGFYLDFIKSVNTYQADISNGTYNNENYFKMINFINNFDRYLFNISEPMYELLLNYSMEPER